MKKKIFASLLIIALSIASLSSCLLIDTDLLSYMGNNSSGGGDTVINVEGGPNYGNINITSTENKNLLAASKALLSSVSVRCVFNEYQYSWNGSYTGTEETGAAGSGVIYKLDKEKGDAYIITNYHVIYNANSTTSNHISDKIYVYLYGMEYTVSETEDTYAIPAVYIGGSMDYDIAVLKVTASTVLMESNAMEVSVANSDEVTVLDTAIAIGNPGNGGLSATVGYINVDSENIQVEFETASNVRTVSLRVMRTDAAVNSGNSGGGLFNDNGELVGIVNAKDGDNSVDNIGYAIPSNVAVAIAESAIYYNDGSIKRCLIGVTVGAASYSTEYDLETGKIYKIEEVMAKEISEGSAADGKIRVGDILNSITVDGKTTEITRIHQIVDAMLYARVGSSVTINITRDGVTSDISIEMTEKNLATYR